MPRISKAAVLFGPNASGKTNLILALATLRDLVLRSNAFTESQFGQSFMPFQWIGAMHGQPNQTNLEIDLLLDRVRFRYSIGFDSQRITWERLLVYQTGKSQRWFERRYDLKSQLECWSPFSPAFKGPRELWVKATRPRSLFLTTAVQLNCEKLKPLFTWFEHGLDILMPEHVGDTVRAANQVRDPVAKSRILTLFRSLNVPVHDLRIADSERGAGDSATIEFLYSRPDASSVWLDGKCQAAGTHRLLALWSPVHDALEAGKLLVIDSFDNELHPLIARFLVQLIGDPRIAKPDAQFLFTSHNVNLMDLDVLRRDQIWLMELGADHSSQLRQVQKSSPRVHEVLTRGYLRGRFGAIPIIQNLLS